MDCETCGTVGIEEGADCPRCGLRLRGLCPSDATACSACGQVPVQSGRRKADYGDFSEYEVRRLVAEYCMSVTLGCTGWGVPFKVWVELHGIAKHDGMFRLIRLPNKLLGEP